MPVFLYSIRFSIAAFLYIAELFADQYQPPKLGRSPKSSSSSEAVIRAMDIPEEDKAKILYKNAQKVLGL